MKHLNFLKIVIQLKYELFLNIQDVKQLEINGIEQLENETFFKI